MSKLICVGHGIYRDEKTRTLFHTVKLPGKKFPTKRKLAASTIKKARDEVALKRSAQMQSRHGAAIDPYARLTTIGELATRYLENSCPDRKGLDRNGQSLAAEKARVQKLLPFWKHKPALEIGRKDCRDYYQWRLKHRARKQFRLGRSVDAELTTLANILEWAVDDEIIKHNPIGIRRRFDNPKLIRHCTKVMPRSDEDFHNVAAHLLGSDQSAPLGWQMLLEGMTGCRTSEILACRLDSAADSPGYFDAHCLHVHRCKDGIDPWALFEAMPGHSPFRDCFMAFLNWHEQRYPHCPFFIPGRNAKQPAQRNSLTHALHRACKDFGIPLVTSHGLRAYFVAVMRSLGVPDNEIASRLGHRNTNQVQQTYGKCTPGWFGARKMDFLPEEFPAAWNNWIPLQSGKIIRLKTYQKLIDSTPKERTSPNQSTFRECKEMPANIE